MPNSLRETEAKGHLIFFAEQATIKLIYKLA